MPVLKETDELPSKMNFDEFIEWREDKEGKWELHDGVPSRLHDPSKGQSERMRHVKAKFKIALALHKSLEENNIQCSAVTDGATVRIDENLSYIPDALVYCDESTIDDDGIAVPEPIIIVEVLSPSTAYKDVSTKLADYFTVPSFMHYLIIDPKLKRVQHHYRDGETIRLDPIENDMLALDPPGISISITETFA